MNGGAGNDLVMGGAGMDWLSGGQGNNMVGGGLDADTYFPVVDVGMDYIVELGGVDRIDLSAHDMGGCYFSRSGDTLNIGLPSGGLIVIENQWIAGSKVEQFVFAQGTVASSYIEYLADNNAGSGSGQCYDEYGRQTMCSPYGLPIVFDLDGDGIELVSINRSHAGFDLDGDGVKDRLGWVAPDDGILALDRNGNGRIDNFDEISFVQDFLGAASDLEGLYAYDTDGDGFLTATDDRFGEFLIWRDSNGNGKSEKHELFTLGELGIVSIALERRDLNPLRPEDEMNQILAKSVFATAEGVSRQVGDVALFVELAGQECGCHNSSSPREFPGMQSSTLQLDGLIP